MRKLAGIVLVISIFAGLLYGQQFLQELAQEAMGEQSIWVLSFFLGVYGMCLAIPFLPGVELGLALMTCFGQWGVLSVFVMTQLALNGAYWFARKNIAADSPRVKKGLNAFERLQNRSGYGWLKTLQKHPSLLLVGLLNVPGNTFLGGGGGVAASYGALRLLSPKHFFMTTFLATAPVPLVFVYAKFLL